MKSRALFILILCLMLAVLLLPAKAEPASPNTHNLPASTLFIPPANNLPFNPSLVPTDSQNVEFVSQIGGTKNAVVVQGNYAYIGVGPRLVILNVATPSQPIVVGQTTIFPDVVKDVAVAGNYAYIANGYNGGLRIVNISNPSAPIEVGFFDTPEYAISVAAVGNYAYVGDFGGDLRVVDVSNPAAPTEVGLFDTQVGSSDVEVAGNYVYLVDGNDLRVVDVSIPDAPTEVGFFDAPELIMDLAVAGDYAYMADLGGDLRIVDVSNPAVPTEVGLFDGPYLAWGVTIAGNHAYVTYSPDFGSGLRVVDISNPTSPIEVGFYGTSEFVRNLAVAGNFAYVADFVGGRLRVVDVSNPALPTEVGFFDTPGDVYEVAVAGNYAYVLDGGGALRVVDVTTPSVVANMGFHDAPETAWRVAAAGNYAYVAALGGGLRVVDVSNPAAPTEVGFFDEPWNASAVAVVGNHAYVTAGVGGLWIVNISDPSAPTELGFYNTPIEPRAIAVAANYAYVAGDFGLRIVDVSNPTAPTEVGFFDTLGSVYAVAVAGDYAYLVDVDYGLRVVDISNPATLTEVGFFNTWGIQDVAVVGNHAYLAAGGGGVVVVDVSNPAVPTEVGYFRVFSVTSSVAATEDFIYVGASGAGLVVLRYTEGLHLEFTQGIQDGLNSLPLVANKPIFARVYVDCGTGCSPLPGVTGVLRGFGPAGELPGSPLSPVNDSITAYHEDWTTQRSDLRKTLNFTLPLEWATGTITLTAEVGDSQLSETATFQEANSLNVIYVPVRYFGVMPDPYRIMAGSQWASHVFPTPRINYIPGRTLEWNRCLEDNFLTCPIRNWNRQRLLNELTTMYDVVNAYVFGWLPLGAYGGGLSDPTWAGGAGKAAFGDENVPSKDNGERIFAHEIAHLLGRHHTNTSDSCGGLDPDSDWPYETAKIQEWGLDASGFGWPISSNSAIKNPDSTYDYMSYCGRLSNNNVWTSPWTYQKIFDRLQSPTSNNLVQSLSGAEPYFIASGLVFTDDTATLDPVWIITTTTPAIIPPPGTEYCLEAQDATNTPLVSHCFDLTFVDYETGELTNVDGFHFMLPYPDGVARVVLKQGAAVLTSQVVSPNAPDVTVLSPNGGESWAASGDYTISWTANDVDGDSLTYMVQYSTDGVEWIPVSGIITATQTTVNAAELPGGSNSLIRVLASDGINTSMDVSDAPFTVARKAPQALIVSPEGDGSIPQDTPLFLMGYSYDLEDGLLEGESLQWHSNRDGDLGTGSRVLVALSPGQHLITFEATDSHNNSTTATLHIQVGYWVYLPVVVK